MSLARTKRLFGLLIVTAATACTENGAGINMKGPNPAAVRSNLAVLPGTPGTVHRIAGDAWLIPVSGSGVAIVIDGGPEPGMQDGFVDHVFLLAQQHPVDLQPRTLRDAEFHTNGHVLLAHGAGTQPVVLAIGNPPPQQVAQIHFMPTVPQSAERYEGYGLSLRTGAWSIPLDEILTRGVAELIPGCGGTGGEAGIASLSTCDSGGPGSTACGTTCLTASPGQCNITCGPGYHSCCNRSTCSCTCVQNSSSGGGEPKPPIQDPMSVPRGRVPRR
jgi:hypothetical protein